MTGGIKTLTAILDYIEAKTDYIYSTYSEKTASRTTRMCIMQTARRFYHCAKEIERRHKMEVSIKKRTKAKARKRSQAPKKRLNT